MSRVSAASRRVFAISWSVVADTLRRKFLWVVLLFALGMTAVVPSLPSYGVGVVEAVFREVTLALIFVMGIALTLVLAATRLPREIERRTVYNILSKNVRRWEHLVGTWVGVTISMAGAIACFTIIAQGVGLLMYGDAMWRLWQGAFAIWLEMGILAAFALAVSSATGPVPTVVATLIFVFAAHSRDALLASYSSPILETLYPSLDTFNVVNPVAHGAGVSAAYGLSMLAVFCGWAIALLAIGTLLFRRRDL